MLFELNKRKITCLLLLCMGFAKLHAQDANYDANVKRYINQYRALAVAEQKRSGIPAAITLAQGVHETQAGASELATMANNHFGIKCKKEWTGETFAHTDDAPNECFRKYSKAEDSYKDHSDYLSKSPRYAELFKLSVTDYAAWAVGLKRCGYATNPRYAQVLIKLVEDYHLQEYTYAANDNVDVNNVPIATTRSEIVPEHDAPQTNVQPAVVTTPVVAAVTPTPVVTATPAVIVETPVVQEVKKDVPPTVVALDNKPVYGQVVQINGLKAIYGRRGDTPLEYAYKTDTRYSKFLEINEIDERPLPYDMYLYLEKKHTKGVKPNHKVTYGESLFGIAQAEGMQIKSLMDLNMLDPGEEPAVGTMLDLQKAVARKPALVKKDATPIAPPQQTVVAEKQVPAVVTSNEIPTKNPIAEITPVVKEPISEVAVTDTKKIQVLSTEPVNPQIEIAKENKQQEEVKIPAVQPVTITEVAKPSGVSQSEVVEAVKHNDVDDKVSVAKVDNNNVALPQPDATAQVKKEDNGTTTVMSSIIDPVPTVEPLPVQNTSAISVDKNEVVINKVAEPEVKREEEPVDELDRLKKKFDKVLYTKSAEPAVAPPIVPKQETMVSDTVAKAAPVKQALPPSDDPKKYYTVKKGDTGYSIAKSHSITMRQLQDWNALEFGDIKEGQKLRIKK
jgi:LysM repeat protein